MTERTKHMEAGGYEMGRESIISGYLSPVLHSYCWYGWWDGHAPDVYKTIITCIRYITGMSLSSDLR